MASRTIGEECRLAARALVEEGTVLGDHVVEELGAGTDLEQVVKPPTGDQDRPTARGAQPAERRGRGVREAVVLGQGPVVVGDQCKVAHGAVQHVSVGSPKA